MNTYEVWEVWRNPYGSANGRCVSKHWFKWTARWARHDWAKARPNQRYEVRKVL